MSSRFDALMATYDAHTEALEGINRVNELADALARLDAQGGFQTMSYQEQAEFLLNEIR